MEHKRKSFEKHLSIFAHAVKVICNQNNLVTNKIFKLLLQSLQMTSIMFRKRKVEIIWGE